MTDREGEREREMRLRVVGRLEGRTGDGGAVVAVGFASDQAMCWTVSIDGYYRHIEGR